MSAGDTIALVVVGVVLVAAAALRELTLRLEQTPAAVPRLPRLRAKGAPQAVVPLPLIDL